MIFLQVGQNLLCGEKAAKVYSWFYLIIDFYNDIEGMERLQKKYFTIQCNRSEQFTFVT